jgi:hypothetical protein
MQGLDDQPHKLVSEIVLKSVFVLFVDMAAQRASILIPWHGCSISTQYWREAIITRNQNHPLHELLSQCFALIRTGLNHFPVQT